MWGKTSIGTRLTIGFVSIVLVAAAGMAVIYYYQSVERATTQSLVKESLPRLQAENKLRAGLFQFFMEGQETGVYLGFGNIADAKGDLQEADDLATSNAALMNALKNGDAKMGVVPDTGATPTTLVNALDVGLLAMRRAGHNYIVASAAEKGLKLGLASESAEAGGAKPVAVVYAKVPAGVTVEAPEVITASQPPAEQALLHLKDARHAEQGMLDTLIAHTSAEFTSALVQIDSAHQATLLAEWVTALLLLAIALFMGISITGSIRTELNAAVATSSAIAGGDLSAKFAAHPSDEIGDLTRSVEKMRDSLVTRIDTLKEVGATVGVMADDVNSTAGDVVAAVGQLKNNDQVKAAAGPVLDDLEKSAGKLAIGSKNLKQISEGLG